MMPDLVNHPSHYTQGGVECIDAIEAALGASGFVSFLRGQVIKYQWRLGLKDSATQDAAKAHWYSGVLNVALTQLDREQVGRAPMLSRTRISELLDYASVYGEFDETTPLGTVSTHNTVFSEGQLHAIIAYKRVLGLLADDWALIPESTKNGGQG